MELTVIKIDQQFSVYTVDRLPWSRELFKNKCTQYAAEYMKGFCVPESEWDILQWQEIGVYPKVGEVHFTGSNANKHEFIFNLRGGVDSLNLYIGACIDREMGEWV